ncbi:uridine kinase [Vulgatibacter sp.]|uniref:uridine kinase n=1 Tax=Vulgatibacter sp. TaxID=1971226 RepID=UPI003562A9E3
MNTAPLVIGVAGGTASGKTTVARRIAEALGETCTLLDQDAYYRDLSDLSVEERAEVNFDHPDAFDVPLLVEHLRALKRGEAGEKPVYSFAAHNREARTERVVPGRVVLLEGILVLGIEAIRDQIDVKIYVDTEDDVRVLRRLTRDVKERGRDFDGVVSQYLRTVRPMHYGFVEPSKRHAHIIIPHGGSNTIAVDMVVGAIRGRLASPEQ